MSITADELAKAAHAVSEKAADVAETAKEAVVSVEKIEKVLEAYSHDIIGKAHRIYEDLKALVAEAKAAL